MKKWIIWLGLVFVLAAANAMIVGKENILRHGRTMLFKLAPVDPRSLIQGYYMALGYEVALQVPADQIQRHGLLVVRLDENAVAQFVRVHGSEPLADGEYLVAYHRKKRLSPGADSFLFQQSRAEQYRGAKYAELKVAPNGKTVLSGLRGNNLEPLGQDQNPEKNR